MPPRWRYLSATLSWLFAIGAVDTIGTELCRQAAVHGPAKTVIYAINESCQGTVPEAIIAFLESTDFEDAIRNAISLGGDSDTLAAITGSIAEAAYGIPDRIREKALSYLDAPLREVYDRWQEFMSDEAYMF